jgi:hypothetical protein
MKKFFLAVIALLMTAGLSAQFYIYLSDGNVLKADSISLVAPVEPEYVQPIHVDDNSLADWDNIPQDKIASATCPADAALIGLKSVKVYADKFYINVLVEIDMDEIPDHNLVPFHVFINTDNSDQTGGYADMFADANTDIIMEGFFFSEEGEACAYEPWVFAWIGEVGGEGWAWEELTAGDFCKSQYVGNFVEIQMLRELIPTNAGWNEDEFGIGFDIEQNWSSVGILPQNTKTEEDIWIGKAHKLQVKIDK